MLTQKNLFFEHVQQKFSLRVLFSLFCQIFCHFQPGVAYESLAYKKRVYSEILVCDFIKKMKLWQVFSCEFFETF